MASVDLGKSPIEVRHMIWLSSITDDEPEVCLLWPVVLHERHGLDALKFTQPLLVDTGFPVAMHVCRESRAVLRNEKLSGLRFRPSSAAGCPVPYREFQPALDTLYWGGENLDAMAPTINDMIITARETPVLELVESLAIELPWGMHPPDALGYYRPLFFPALHTLSLVLPDSTSSMTSRLRRGFRQPARRCRLRRISAEEGARIKVCADVLMGNETDESAEVPLVPEGLSMALSCLKIEEELIGEVLCIELNLAGGDDTDTTVYAREPEVIAQTFIEYQKDGSWKEICAERTFVEFGEMVRSGAYVPLAERPDPREVRVNDIDGAFDVVYDAGDATADSADFVVGFSPSDYFLDGGYRADGSPGGGGTAE
ncbi:hypothetical protein LMH87_009988 [Akanthomyces muscarius]|uniref:2EXR domain-containing protein n=1 Tax=Akanthomyces muscarius TaxID=2231603 RepID=A0A9W8UK28_AKAMU|nr:hypothetical protein LMH87_009988 [Akanthomyces muscarius]KAJ4153504.1 hypothetical protein LMH87_009988 [Akanthomyces muscarius]